MYTTSVDVRALVKVCYIGYDCPSFQERMDSTHTQWPVFIGVWMRCSGGLHPGEVAQSGLARFEVATVEVARVEVARVCSKHRRTGPYWNGDED